jgi:hypothetical protein
MADEVDTLSRLYFSVLDASASACLPSVLGGSPQGDHPPFQVVPLRRFVKLLGAGESLQEVGSGRLHRRQLGPQVRPRRSRE